MTLNAVVFPAPFGPISPKIVPSSASSETSSSATMPPKRSEAFWSESRPIPVGAMLRIPLAGVEILLPELLHRGAPGRGLADGVVRRVADRPYDEVASRVDVEDVDAAGRLLERAEKDAVPGQCAAEDRAVHRAVEDEQDDVPALVGQEGVELGQDAV